MDSSRSIRDISLFNIFFPESIACWKTSFDQKNTQNTYYKKIFEHLDDIYIEIVHVRVKAAVD